MSSPPVAQPDQLKHFWTPLLEHVVAASPILNYKPRAPPRTIFLLLSHVVSADRLSRGIDSETMGTYMLECRHVQHLLYTPMRTRFIVRMFSCTLNDRGVCRVPHARPTQLTQAAEGARDTRHLTELMQQTSCLSCPVHKHGERAEVKQHFISAKILSDDIIRVDTHNGQTEEQVEIVIVSSDDKTAAPLHLHVSEDAHRNEVPLGVSVLAVHPTEIRTSISPSSAVEFNTTSALANYTTEEAMQRGIQPGTLNSSSIIQRSKRPVISAFGCGLTRGHHDWAWARALNHLLYGRNKYKVERYCSHGGSLKSLRNMLSSYDENSQALHALEQGTALKGPLMFSLLLRKLDGDTRHRFEISRGTKHSVVGNAVGSSSPGGLQPDGPVIRDGSVESCTDFLSTPPPVDHRWINIQQIVLCIWHSLKSTENLRHLWVLRTIGEAVALSGKARLCCNAKSSGELIHVGISSAIVAKDK
uniref:Uncharacterized protein n=1 Tax=Timema genevievae TaxID=629358 RepID=A0A7R9PHC1_TIMGE|nr:unnamed protein product [Timema genevievae]